VTPIDAAATVSFEFVGAGVGAHTLVNLETEQSVKYPSANISFVSALDQTAVFVFTPSA
jgi:hypothetical protein